MRITQNPIETDQTQASLARVGEVSSGIGKVNISKGVSTTSVVHEVKELFPTTDEVFSTTKAEETATGVGSVGNPKVEVDP